jgi:hypothetical protein
MSKCSCPGYFLPFWSLQCWSYSSNHLPLAHLLQMTKSGRLNDSSWAMAEGSLPILQIRQSWTHPIFRSQQRQNLRSTVYCLSTQRCAAISQEVVVGRSEPSLSCIMVVSACVLGGFLYLAGCIMILAVSAAVLGWDDDRAISARIHDIQRPGRATISVTGFRSQGFCHLKNHPCR